VPSQTITSALCRAARLRLFLPVKVLSSLFRRVFLEALEDTFYQKCPQFLGPLQHLRDAGLFHDYLFFNPTCCRPGVSALPDHKRVKSFIHLSFQLLTATFEPNPFAAILF
jgi:hypothetical protein